MIRSAVTSFLQGWDKFWFGPKNLLGLAYMRIFLCGALTILYVIRSVNYIYYTNDSWIPREFALKVLPEGMRPPFLWFFWPDSWALPMHLLLVALLFLLTLGVGGRWLMWAAWIIDIAFYQRNYGVNFGVDVMGVLFLFYMSFTQSCERLSVMNLIRKKKTFAESDALSSGMMRLMQIQISVIYAYTGFEKLKGASWWDGTALWSVLANPQLTTMNFTFLRYFPWLIAMLGFLTVIFEIYFPAMMFWKKPRYLWLFMGFGLHFGIGLSMGIWSFSTVMVSTYFLFIEPKYLEALTAKLLRTA